MSMATIGVGVGLGAASYGLSYLNRPGVYNPSANNALGYDMQNALMANSSAMTGAVNKSTKNFGNQVTGLSNTYGLKGGATSANYLNNTGNALSNYGTDITNLANFAPQREFNAAQAGLNFNAANMGTYGAMANDLSNESQQTRLGMINAAMPSWNQQYSQGMENAAQMQQGLIPADVQASLGRTSAFKALGSGTGGGSGLGRNLTARDLGLNSLQLQQQGTAQAQSLAGQQYGMAVNGLQTNAGTIFANNGVGSSQAMQAGALGTNIAATGLQTGLQGQLSTQGLNYGQMMGLYGNQYNTQVGADQSIMSAQDAAAIAAMQANAAAISGNYQTQMNGNLMNYQSQNALAAYNNNAMQGALGYVGGGIMGAYNSGGFSGIGMAPSSYSNQFGSDMMSSGGFYENQGAANAAYGAGSHTAFQPGSGWYNQYYS
jgi:hypothetical protein